MPRPTMDVNGEEYQALLRGREMYRLYGMDWKDMMWAGDTLARLEKKLLHGDFTNEDRVDLKKAKDIHARVSAKTSDADTGSGDETGQHVTTHYIWRTQQDDLVRPAHAENDGKIFAWNSPPSTGHPGEEANCRCWAEPYGAEMEEYKTQTVTRAERDRARAWGNFEIGIHYQFGNGEPYKLHEIGLLHKVIHHARTHDQTEVGGGSIFERVENQIFREARQKGEGSFKSKFMKSRYFFGDLVWALGHASVRGNMDVNVTKEGEYLAITADINYKFLDRVGDFEGTYDENTGSSGVDSPGATPFYITDVWSTRLEAVIKRDESESQFPGN